MPWLGIGNLEASPGVWGCSPLRGEKKRGTQTEVLAPHLVLFDLCPGENRLFKFSTLY